MILGIFYTNNNKDKKILDSSLKSIDRAVKNHACADIVVNSWTPVDCGFKNIITKFNTYTGSLNIALQILEALALNLNKYEKVCFLEHDVLYPEDYFDRISKINIIRTHLNLDYIGMNAYGYQYKLPAQFPLHQMTMNFEFAVTHFKNFLIEFLSQQNYCLEPQLSDITSMFLDGTGTPSVHINHKNHLTSHCDTYDQNVFATNHTYWGDFTKYYPMN